MDIYERPVDAFVAHFIGQANLFRGEVTAATTFEDPAASRPALPSSVDVVVGGGNAAFCAGLAAAERRVSVLMLERAPEEEAGGWFLKLPIHASLSSADANPS